MTPAAARTPGRAPASPGALARALRLAALFGVVLAVAAAPAAAEKRTGLLRCTISGTPEADVLRGTPGEDVICAKGGDDVVRALGGADHVFAGNGEDLLIGGPGRDHLLGGRHGDRLAGRAGSDFLYGEYGNDRLIGGPGDDALYGHFGRDTLRGGPGSNHLSGGPGRDLGDPVPWRPDCPWGTTEYCTFSMHIDIRSYCPSFTRDSGNCFGTTPYGPVGWRVDPGPKDPFANFSWGQEGNEKRTDYGAVYGIVTGRLFGRVPNSGSPSYSIHDAWSVSQPGVSFYTPNWSVSGPGKLGGPLWLNFVSGIRGADMYIDGYLFRRY